MYTQIVLDKPLTWVYMISAKYNIMLMHHLFSFVLVIYQTILNVFFGVALFRLGQSHDPVVCSKLYNKLKLLGLVFVNSKNYNYIQMQILRCLLIVLNLLLLLYHVNRDHKTIFIAIQYHCHDRWYKSKIHMKTNVQATLFDHLVHHLYESAKIWLTTHNIYIYIMYKQLGYPIHEIINNLAIQYIKSLLFTLGKRLKWQIRENFASLKFTGDEISWS